MIAWCEVLSTEGHRWCHTAGCDCLCHIAKAETAVRRPHGFDRYTWSIMSDAQRRRAVRFAHIGRRRRREPAEDPIISF